MTCASRYATAADYDALLGAGIDLDNVEQVSEVNQYLELAASDIHVALAAGGMLDCAYAGWAVNYLKKLNILDAAVIHSAPCGNRLRDDQRDRWREWLDRQYELIRLGKVSLCAVDTGSEFPAFGVAEMSYTVWSAGQIASNRWRRYP